MFFCKKTYPKIGYAFHKKKPGIKMVDQFTTTILIPGFFSKKAYPDSGYAKIDSNSKKWMRF